MNRRVYRSWGNYRIVYRDKNTKIKIITVLPYRKSSLQYHKLRSEYWYILKGKLRIQLQNEVEQRGFMVYIPPLRWHRFINTQSENLVFLEIQNGICRENDIVREKNEKI